MKVFIKNKIISLGGDSEVLNENQEPVYKVNGKVFTFTKKKELYNMQGTLCYTIRNSFWNFFSYKVFINDANGNLVATIKKGRWSFNAKYEILNTEKEMSIDGKFFSRTSNILKNGQPVATIIRDFTLVKDAFTLETNENDIAFYIALVIGLDNLVDKRLED